MKLKHYFMEVIEMDERDWYPDISKTASFHECTGLMPRLPVTEAERESYKELFGMEIPKD